MKGSLFYLVDGNSRREFCQISHDNKVTFISDALRVEAMKGACEIQDGRGEVYDFDDFWEMVSLLLEPEDDEEFSSRVLDCEDWY